MENQGDIYLFQTNDGGEISIENGIFLMDGGLETTVYLSLFTNFMWWGNDIFQDSEKLESDFESILTKNLTNQTRLDAIILANKALDWLITENIASEINIDAIILGIEIMVLEIEIIQPNFDIIEIKYEINWNNEIKNPIFLKKPVIN